MMQVPSSRHRWRFIPVAFLAATALALTATQAFATTFSTNTGTCLWSGGSNGGGVSNYSWTNNGGGSCLASGVQVKWYFNGTWHSENWIWDSTYVQDNELGSLSSQHQVYVNGLGYSQIEFSSY